jgi:hypothetical protein
VTYYLFLDDIRMPGDVTWVPLPSAKYVVVRNFEQFTSYIAEHGLPTHISFDNDLGEGEPEGKDCAKWLVEQLLDGALAGTFTYTIHSKNTVAGPWIQRLLDNVFKHLATEANNG